MEEQNQFSFAPKKGKRARGNWLLILPDEMESTTQGGIALPDQAKEKPKSGKVILANGDYSVDEQVWYPSYAPTEIDKIKIKGYGLKQVFHLVSMKECFMSEVEEKPPTCFKHEFTEQNMYNCIHCGIDKRTLVARGY